VLERTTRAVLRFRFVVLALWVALAVFGVVASTKLPAVLSNSFAVPGTDSDRAQEVLLRGFGERTDGAFTVVFTVRHPSDKAQRARLQQRLAAAARAVPSGRARPLRSGAGVLYGDIVTTLDLQHAKAVTVALRRALADPGGRPFAVTGQPAIQHDLDPVLAGDLRRGEAIALPLALLVLLLALGVSLAVAIPFLFAACSIAGTLAAVYALAHTLTLTSYVTNLVELVGIGLAIDYSLLVVSRFRDEIARGRSTDDAVVQTMATAGRAVVFSGLTVAVGLALLLFVPVPFVRSMGVGGLLVPLVSIAAALTLQPVLLSLFGRRGVQRAPAAAFVRARLPERIGGRLPARAAGSDLDSGFWARLARAIMRRPVVFLAIGATLLVAAAVPSVFLRLTPASLAGLPPALESVRGYTQLRDGVGPGAITPLHVVVDAGRPGAARTPQLRAAVDRLGDGILRNREAYVVATGVDPTYVDRSGRYAQLVVVGRHEYGDGAMQALVRSIRREAVPGAAFPAGTRVLVGGAPAQGVDFLSRAYGSFPWLILAVIGITFAVLARAFRSVVLPLKAVILNLLSVAAACGLLVIVFRWGVGADVLGLYRMDQVEGWIPIFLFATLFGVSMDYEVFMVSRMREAWDEVPDNARAVAHGLERTGRIVTAAAAIMIVACSGFVAGRVAGLQEFGVGLALAVFVDATVVRVLLVPSLMAIFDRYNWWLPARLRRAPA
jgi:RND superfamily putative drug exporter